MSIRSSGMWCDICNSPILGEWLKFGFDGVQTSSDLHCHKKCGETYLAHEMPLGERVYTLPDSPLKKSLLKMFAEGVKVRRYLMKEGYYAKKAKETLQ